MVIGYSVFCVLFIAVLVLAVCSIFFFLVFRILVVFCF